MGNFFLFSKQSQFSADFDEIELQIAQKKDKPNFNEDKTSY